MFAGHFLLTNLLADLLLAAAPGSRVVNLSSQAHEMVQTQLHLIPVLERLSHSCLNFLCALQGRKDIQWEDLMFEKRYDGWEVYCHSKLANILFNVELSKRLKCT